MVGKSKEEWVRELLDVWWKKAKREEKKSVWWKKEGRREEKDLDWRESELDMLASHFRVNIEAEGE